MAVFDPRVIQRFADRLYGRAVLVMIVSTVLGVLSGGIMGLAVCMGAIVPALERDSSAAAGGLVVGLIGGLLGAVIFGLGGFLGGWERAFRLKLQAQVALCQLKIEENTRRGLM
ncbi:MAG: hypothetical protein JXA14_00195 [Anaerolineae bacterium]|nr:hypothetical protein [Anaerolineae bacterium]